ncbi:MAG: SDR family NAD(P)-dependent oxidoreductase [Polyangiaceae bacterium]|jgi:glucose 1-dehydrogenase
MKLRGKVAIVTGSSQGIGRAVAKRLAQEGASVVINYSKNPDPAREAVAEVEAAGASALMLKANLGSVAEVRKLVADTVAHFGSVDILVNNAGVEKHAAFWDVTEEDADASYVTGSTYFVDGGLTWNYQEQ